MSPRYKETCDRRLETEESDSPEDSLLSITVPREWLTAAAHLPGRSMQLATLIWCVAGMNGKRSISLSNVDAIKFGLDRNAKYRALQWLEEAGLVRVQRKLGRSPIVTLVVLRAGDDE